ncbi:MAG: S41 family peptidase [Armatimonadetes bacterium]|nr:S41 family peptidase [Armatimonadota bacterium]
MARGSPWKSPLFFIPLLAAALTLLLASPGSAQDPRLELMLATARQVRDLLIEEHVLAPSAQTLTRAAWRGMRRHAPALVEPSAWEGLESAYRAAVAADPELGSPMVEAALRSMVDSLGDPYSAVLTPDQRRWEEQAMKTGSFSGIGVELGWKQGLRVVSCLDRSPARSSGLRSGDRILAVDGKAVGDMTFYEAGNLLLGPVGRAVELKLQRGARQLDVRVPRARIELPGVGYRKLDSSVGYVRIGYFGADTAGKVRSSLAALREQGIDRVVVDLRNNPGGDLEQGLKVAGFFTAGTLVIVEKRSGRQKLVNRQPAYWTGKALFLVNRGSASAAELLAQSVQGKPGRIVMGEKTFGKARIQTRYSLPGGGAIHITTARYLSASGADIDGQGLAPEVLLPDTGDPLKEAARHLRD